MHAYICMDVFMRMSDENGRGSGEGGEGLIVTLEAQACNITPFQVCFYKFTSPGILLYLVLILTATVEQVATLSMLWFAALLWCLRIGSDIGNTESCCDTSTWSWIGPPCGFAELSSSSTHGGSPWLNDVLRVVRLSRLHQCKPIVIINLSWKFLVVERGFSRHEQVRSNASQPKRSCCLVQNMACEGTYRRAIVWPVGWILGMSLV
jgi:hypothetical protein